MNFVVQSTDVDVRAVSTPACGCNGASDLKCGNGGLVPLVYSVPQWPWVTIVLWVDSPVVMALVLGNCGVARKSS